MNNKVALVTGGAGFIGSNLTKQLIHEFSEVIVIDNLINGKTKNLKSVADNPKLTFVNEDIRSIDKISALIEKTNVIYHLACLGVRHSIHSPKENYDVNANGTFKLLEAAKGIVDNFVYVSTSEVYGTARHVPMSENHPTFPLTVYGAGKLAGEALTRSYFETYNMPTTVIRPFNSFGPNSHHEGDSGEVIPKFMIRSMNSKELIIFGDGTQTRDFTFVEDTARGIGKAGKTNNAIGHTINIGSGSEIQIKDLATKVLKITNSNATIIYKENRPGDVLRLYSDSSLAKKVLDHTPSTDLDTGLSKLYEWYKNTYTKEQIIELGKSDLDANWILNH